MHWPEGLKSAQVMPPAPCSRPGRLRCVPAPYPAASRSETAPEADPASSVEGRCGWKRRKTGPAPKGSVHSRRGAIRMSNTWPGFDECVLKLLQCMHPSLSTVTSQRGMSALHDIRMAFLPLLVILI